MSRKFFTAVLACLLFVTGLTGTAQGQAVTAIAESFTPEDWDARKIQLRAQTYNYAVFLMFENSDWSDSDIWAGVEVFPAKNIGLQLRGRRLDANEDLTYMKIQNGSSSTDGPGVQTELTLLGGFDTGPGKQAWYVDRKLLRAGASFAFMTLDRAPSKRNSLSAFLVEGLYSESSTNGRFYGELTGSLNFPLRSRQVDRVIEWEGEKVPQHVEAHDDTTFVTYADNRMPAATLGTRLCAQQPLYAGWSFIPRLCGVGGFLGQKEHGTMLRVGPAASLTMTSPWGEISITPEVERSWVVAGSREFYWASTQGPVQTNGDIRPEGFWIFSLNVAFNF